MITKRKAVSRDIFNDTTWTKSEDSEYLTKRLKKNKISKHPLKRQFKKN